jgi:hypothetical protein
VETQFSIQDELHAEIYTSFVQKTDAMAALHRLATTPSAPELSLHIRADGILWVGLDPDRDG